MVSEREIVSDWVRLKGEGASKAARLDKIKAEYGVTKKRAEEIIKASGEWYDHADTFRYHTAQPDEDELNAKYGRQFTWLMVGFGILALVILAAIFLPGLLREKNPFNRGDGYYCTDEAGLNCYAD